MTEVKPLCTEKHTKPTYLLEEVPSLSMQAYMKKHKRVREISRTPYLLRIPTTKAHFLLLVVAQHLWGIWSSVNCIQILIWSNLYSPLCINLCLATLHTKQNFARNVWRGAKASLKKELRQPSSSELNWSGWESWQVLADLQALWTHCPVGTGRGCKTPKHTSTCKKKLVLNMLASLLGSAEIFWNTTVTTEQTNIHLVVHTAVTTAQLFIFWKFSKILY